MLNRKMTEYHIVDKRTNKTLAKYNSYFVSQAYCHVARNINYCLEIIDLNEWNAAKLP